MLGPQNKPQQILKDINHAQNVLWLQFVKPEINNKNITSKSLNVWVLNNVFLNKQWVKKSITEIRKYFKLNAKDKITF